MTYNGIVRLCAQYAFPIHNLGMTARHPFFAIIPPSLKEGLLIMATANTLTSDQKKFIWIAVLVLAAVVIAVGVIMAVTGPKEWSRPDMPMATAAVHRGQDLEDFSQNHGQPTLIMAMVNRDGLNVRYPETCDPIRYNDWPRPTRGYFCNDRLNLREASTLTPGDDLRILATEPVSLSPAITTTLAGAGASKRVAVLVDGASQKNLDHAAAIAFALQENGRLASIWVYTQNGMFEFIDTGRAIAFNRDNQGIVGALTALSIQPVERVVVVTGSTLRGLDTPRGMQPVIGYCMRSGCQPGMQRLTKATDGHYVPYVAG